MINSQLARGKHLILTPGVYDVARSIEVKRADTVVLGLGLATLTAVDGAIPLTLADRPGVIVAGVTIDAGSVESPVLLQVGTQNGNNGRQHDSAGNPTTLVRRVLPRRRPAHRQGRHRPARSTATTS